MRWALAHRHLFGWWRRRGINARVFILRRHLFLLLRITPRLFFNWRSLFVTIHGDFAFLLRDILWRRNIVPLLPVHRGFVLCRRNIFFFHLHRLHFFERGDL